MAEDEGANWPAWIADIQDFFDHPDSAQARIVAGQALRDADGYLADLENPPEDAQRTVTIEFNYEEMSNLDFATHTVPTNLRDEPMERVFEKIRAAWKEIQS